MGLRDELQAEIAEAFDEDLADAVHTFTCERIVSTSWNPKRILQKTLRSIMKGVGFYSVHTVNMRSKHLEYWPPIRKLQCFKMKLPKSQKLMMNG